MKIEIIAPLILGFIIAGILSAVIWLFSEASGSYNDTMPVTKHEVIIIDDCEYIYISRRPAGSDMAIAHKGNCKNH